MLKQRHANQCGNFEYKPDGRRHFTGFYFLECRPGNTGPLRKVLLRPLALLAPEPDLLTEQ